MPQINNGINKVEFGPKGVGDTMGTALTVLGFTAEDSFKINQSDAETTDFFAEEIDLPAFTSTKAGEMSFTFTVMNPDPATLVRMMGGTTTGTGATSVYTAPLVLPIIEQSMKVTPKIGFGFNIPRGLVTAKFTDSMGRNALLGIEVTVKVLAPSGGTAPFTTFQSA
jgi:hypothetical protein